MILKTGKEPQVEHIRVPVGTNKVSFGSVGDSFATVPVSDLSRGGDVWIVRLGPRELSQPTFIFWSEPKISKKGFSADWAGYPQAYRDERLKFELEKFGAPDDVLIESVRSMLDPADTGVRVTFWEVTA